MGEALNLDDNDFEPLSGKDFINMAKYRIQDPPRYLVTKPGTRKGNKELYYRFIYQPTENAKFTKNLHKKIKGF